MPDFKPVNEFLFVEIVKVDKKEFDALMAACKELHLNACFGAVRHKSNCEPTMIADPDAKCQCNAGPLDKSIGDVCKAYSDIKLVL